MVMIDVKMIEPAEISPIDMLDWINEWQQKEEIKADLIPLCFYDFMVTNEMIEVFVETKKDYWKKAIQAVKAELNIEIGICKTTDALRAYGEFEQQEKDQMFSPKNTARLQSKAKKLIVFDYFRKK